MLELSAEEAEIVAAEASAAAGVLPGPRKEQALALAGHASDGALPDDLVATLEQIIGASLQGGRARQLYKAEGERVLTRLLARTPGGQRRQEDLDAVNRALRSLGGRVLDGVTVAMRAPGHFTVSLQTEGVGVVLVVRPDGVAVESLTA
ncbi:MAG TPA: hypothetical protein VGR90_05680 [Acidimicrobiales bacterium]|nr:hypothetical protein [Acidimicrobiales bacterium]